jgi:hypothetical protein
MNQLDTNILTIYSSLLELGFIAGPTDFVKKIGYHKVSWAKVQAGERGFPEDKIENVCKAFGIKKEFVLNGIGDMFLKRAPIKKIEKVIKVNIVANKVKYTDRFGLNHELTFEILK